MSPPIGQIEMPRKFLAALIFLLHGTVSQAGEDPFLLEALPFSLEDIQALDVTISTHTPQVLSKAPSVVTLITAQDIKATGATNLVEVLEGVPGIHVRASQFGFRPLVHFRGTNATQTLLMVNGAPVKDLSWGFGMYWKGLPASAIDRIEIIRGPGSALFGSDAASGVINVITKTAKPIDHDEAGLRLGHDQTLSGWVQQGGQWNGIDVGLTAVLSTTEGHAPFIASDLLNQPGHAAYGWDGADLRFSLARDHWRLLADFSGHDNLQLGLVGRGILDPVTQASDSRYGVQWRYDNPRFGEQWGLNAELGYRHVASSSGDGFFEGPGTINQLDSAEYKLNYEVSGLYSGLRGHALRVGVGGSHEAQYEVDHRINGVIQADAAQQEQARRIHYAFVQDTWMLSDAWELTAGARYDHYSDFGNAFNPRLAVVWHSTDRLTTKLMYGHAFRAPTYLELYSESISHPNAGLQPEQSRTWDLAFSYAASRALRFDINFFRIEQSDLIAADVSNTFQNVGDNTLQGVEMEARYQVAPTLGLVANYTRRNQENALYRDYTQPDWEAYFRADWNVRPNLTWNLQTNWIGERARKSTDTRAALEGYALVDTTLRFAPSRKWEVAASIRNVFDADAREYTGASIRDDLPLPGRNIYVEVRHHF